MGKYLELFRGEVGDLTEKTKLENKPYVAYSTKEGKVAYTVVPKLQPDNEIWYTTNNNVAANFNDICCNTTLVSNTYENGKGVAKFKESLTYITSENLVIDVSGGDGRAFVQYDTNLVSLSLPNSLENMYSGSLFAYRSLDEIVIGKNVKNIYNTSIYIMGLNKLKFNGTLSDWCNINFINQFNPAIRGDYTSKLTPTYISKNLYINDALLVDLVIPNDINELKQYAFYYLESLKTLDLNNVQIIGDSVFEGCTNITSITIPSTVTSIGNNAFKGITLSADNFINNSSLDAEANDYWGAKVVITTDDGLQIQGTKVVGYVGDNGTEESPKTVTIPNNITYIGDDVFSYLNYFSINYEGTKDQWSSIEKYKDYYYPPYWAKYTWTDPNNQDILIIHCTDGDVETETYGI